MSRQRLVHICFAVLVIVVPSLFFKAHKYPLSESLVYLQDKILCSNKKEQTTDTQSYMHELWKRLVWKKGHRVPIAQFNF